MTTQAQATQSNTPRRGRPPGTPNGAEPLTRKLHIRLTETEHRLLAEMAAAQRRTVTQVVKGLLFPGR